MNSARVELPLNAIRFAPALVMAGLACFVVASVHATMINYLTDARSVSGWARVYTDSYTQPPYQIVSYSGDYTGSATTSSFADFQGNANGSATLNYASTLPNGQQGFGSVTAQVGTFQTSYLHPDELYYSSYEWGGNPNEPERPLPSGWAEGRSSLQVTFSVSGTVAYNLMCMGTADPLACWDTYALSSANQGALASGDTGTMWGSMQYGVPINYSGTFYEGDVYTLNLCSDGALDGGGLVVDLKLALEPHGAVPEPSPTADVVGVIAGLYLVWRWDKKQVAMDLIGG